MLHFIKKDDKIYLVIFMWEGENIIGENIKRLRRQNGLKQETLAGKLNIKRQTLSAYERGVTLPDIYVLRHIADLFSITLDEISRKYEKTTSENQKHTGHS